MMDITKIVTLVIIIYLFQFLIGGNMRKIIIKIFNKIDLLPMLFGLLLGTSFIKFSDSFEK